MHDVIKVVRPPLPTVLVHRTHLVAQLQEAIVPRYQKASSEGRSVCCNLILCCAPAGYGKTTLLAEFARSTDVPCCWYFLDQSDTDPVVFLRTLLSSIRQAFPQFGITLDPLVHSYIPEDSSTAMNIFCSALDALCEAIANEISTHVVLILSNYEEINGNKTLASLVNYLLKTLPSQVTLIIESRMVPDFSFASLVIQDAVGGLDREALRFSAREISELAGLQGSPPLTDVEAEHLANSFDGWIAGILLGTHLGEARLRRLPLGSIQNKRLTRPQEQSLRASTEYRSPMLFTYVVDAVLKQLDTATVSFLQTISIFQQINSAMCNVLCECNDAAERLEHIEHQGLFLVSYENIGGITYTFHPVIRDLLCEQLRKLDLERFQALHRQASTLWRVDQNYEQAMYHALTGNAVDLAISLILEVSEHLLQQGQVETMLRWMSALAVDVQESHPHLLLLRATILLRRGQQASALSMLEKAEILMSDSSEAEAQAFSAKLTILRSRVLFQTGKYSQAEVLCQRILLHTPTQERTLRATAETYLGICANLQGLFISGIGHLHQALQIWANQPPPDQAVEIHRALANTYHLMGNFLLAKHHLTIMLDSCEQLQDVLEKGNAFIVQGLIAQDQGLASVAEAAFLQALQLARSVPYGQRGEAYALVNLASLAVEQEQYTQALSFAEQGLILAKTFGNRSLVNDALMSQALSYLFLNDPTSALLTVDQMDTPVLSEGAVGYERIWRDLTYGLIHLSQDRVEEAITYLAAIEMVLDTTLLQRARFQAKLRLAACYIVQTQLEQSIRLLQEVVSLLTTSPSYLHLVQVELHWLPALLPVIRTHSQLASFRTFIGLAELPLIQDSEGRSLDRPAPSMWTLAIPRTPTLAIYAFGEPAVLLEGQPIRRWRLALVKELFFFLLDKDHPISKEVILAALWPEYDEQASQAFHNTLYHLRKLFGEASVVFHPSGYALDLTACYGDQIFYDVRAFQYYQIEAEQALTLGEETRAKEALGNMVQLYRGDYGRAFYNDWCTFRREALRTAYLEAHHQLAQIAWRAEAWNESAEHWRQMLRVDNCLEEAHNGLMHCYFRSGKRGLALRQYQTCQKVLEEELGVQPGHMIQQFYDQLTTNQNVE